MKKLLTFALVLLLVLGIIGCSSDNGQSKAVTPAVDKPLFTADEACALVNNYLESKGESVIIGWRRAFLSTLSNARPQFSALYQGNGKWDVWALGRDYETGFLYSGGLWNLYEASRIVEPANDQARAVLVQIQTFTG